MNLPNIGTRILEKELYVPDLVHNLISVSHITREGKVVNFSEISCKILSKKSKLLAVGKKMGKLYVLDGGNCSLKEAANCSKDSSDEILWHRRFCHLGMDNVRKMIPKE